MTLYIIIAAIIAASGGILYLKHRLKKGDKAIKQNETLKDQKEKTVKLNEEKKDVDIQTEEIEDKLDSADSVKLANSYGDKLQNNSSFHIRQATFRYGCLFFLGALSAIFGLR